NRRVDELPQGSEPSLSTVGAEPLAGARASRQAPGAQPAVQERVALHPPLRGLVARRRRPVLRRPPDGRLVPAPLRTAALPPEGHGRPLDAARADLGGGEGPPERPRLQPVAIDGAALRRALSRTSNYETTTS